MRKNINISLEPQVYQQAKELIPPGEISPFINNLLKKYLAEQKKQQLKAAYQRISQSQTMKAEDKVWEGSVEDGFDK